MNADKLIKEVYKDRELYDVYVAVENAWVLPLDILAMATILTGNLADCMELLEAYDDTDNDKFEDALIDFVSRGRADITDFYHDELDWDYISNITL